MREHSGKIASCLVVAAILISAPAAWSKGKKSATNESAPQPDPTNPVNYIEWVNDVFGVPAKRNAAKTYQEAIDLFTLRRRRGGTGSCHGCSLVG